LESNLKSSPSIKSPRKREEEGEPDFIFAVETFYRKSFPQRKKDIIKGTGRGGGRTCVNKKVPSEKGPSPVHTLSSKGKTESPTERGKALVTSDQIHLARYSRAGGRSLALTAKNLTEEGVGHAKGPENPNAETQWSEIRPARSSSASSS